MAVRFHETGRVLLGAWSERPAGCLATQAWRRRLFCAEPKLSAFFQTNLEILLKYLGTSALILAGMAADICVVFSADDPYMRDFDLYVPSHCAASESAERSETVLSLIQRVLKANISRSTDLELKKIISAAKARSHDL